MDQVEQGRQYLREGDLDRAAAAFEAVLKADASSIDGFKGMAEVHHRRADWMNALNTYNNLIYHATARDDVVDSYLAKAVVLEGPMNHPAKAYTHYERVLDFVPDVPAAWLGRAGISAREGRWAEACREAEGGLACATDRERPWLLLFLGLGRAASFGGVLTRLRGLLGVGSRPADDALTEALLLLPDLADLVTPGDIPASVLALRPHVPRPPLPRWFVAR